MKKKLILSAGALIIIIVLIFAALAASAPSIVRKALSGAVNGTADFTDIKIGLSKASISGLSITDNTGCRAVYVPEAELSYNLIYIFSGKPLKCLRKIRISSPELDINHSGDGSINIASLFSKSGNDKDRLNGPETLDLECDAEILNAGISFSDYSIERRPLKMEMSGICLRSSYIRDAEKFSLDFKAEEIMPSKAEWSLKGEYSLKKPFCNINGGISSVDFASWLRLAAPELGIKALSGSSSVSVRCKGRGKTLQELADSIFAEASLSVKDYSLRVPMLGSDVSSVNAFISASKNGVSAERISGFFMGAPFNASISLSDYSKQSLSGKFSAENISHDKLLNMPLLAKTGASSLVSGGSTSVSGSVEGSISSPSVRLFIKSGGIDAGYSYIDSISASLEASRKSVAVHGIDCFTDGFHLKGSGWIFPDSRKLLLSFNGDGCPSFLPPQVSMSSAGCRFFVAGSFDNPVVAGELKASGLAASSDGTSMSIGNADSGFVYSGGSVYLPDLRISGNSGSIYSSAVYDINDSAVSASMRADSYGVTCNGASAVVSGDISVAGTASDPLASADISVQGSFSNYGGTFSVPASASKDFVNFSASGTACGMDIDAAGVASVPDKTVEAVFSVKGADSSYFSSSEELPSVKADLQGSVLRSPDFGVFSSDIFQSGKKTGKAATVFTDSSILAFAAFEKPEIGIPEKGALSIAKGTLDDAAFIISGTLNKLSAVGSASYNGKIAGLDLDAIDFGAYADGKKLVIENLSAIGADGSAYVSGVAYPGGRAELKASLSEINANSVLNNLDLSAFGIDVRQLLTNPDLVSFQGYAYLDSDLNLKKGDVRTKSRLFLPEGFWRNERIALFSTLASVNDRIMLDHFDLAMGISHFSGSGYAGLKPDSPVSLAIQAEKVNLSRILAVSPYHDIDIRGRADGEGIISGSVRNPVISAHVSINHPSFMGQRAKSLSADMRSENGTISLENMIINMPSGEIHGTGTILADGRMKMSLNADSLRCSDIICLKDFVDASSGEDGLLKMEAEVCGTQENPSGVLSFSTTPISFHKNRFDSVSGRIAYNEGRIKLDSISVRKGKEVYSASGDLALRLPINPARRGFITKFFTDADVTLSMENGRIESLMSVIPSLDEEPCSGSINGKISMNMSMAKRKSDINIDIKAENGSVYGFPFDILSLNIDRDGRAFKCLDIDFRSGDAFLKIGGDYDGDGEDKITFLSKNFRLESLRPFLVGVPENFLPAGRCDIDGFIAGSMRAPDIESKLHVADARLGNVPLGEINGKFTTDQTMMFVDFTGEVGGDLAIKPERESIIINGNEDGNILSADVSVSSDDGTASMRAKIPFGFERFMFQHKGDMIGGIKADYANLALLGIFMPLNGPAEGVLKADIRFAGSYPDMSVRGSASVKNANFTPYFLKNPIQDLNGTVVFDRKDVMADDISGKLGGGGFKAAARADIGGMNINSAHALIYASDLDIACSELFSGKVSGNLEFSVDGEKKKLSGNASIKDSVLSVSPAMIAAAAAGDEEEQEANSQPEKERSSKDDAKYDFETIRKLRLGLLDEDRQSAKSSKAADSDDSPFGKYIPDFFKGTEIDVNAEVADGVWGTFLSSQVQIKGNVKAMGSLEDPNLLGKLELSKGNIAIPLVAAPFKLREGTLEFSGKGYLPDMDIMAESNYDGYTAYLTVSGNAAEPKINIDGASSYYSDDMDYYASSSYSASSLSSMSNKYMSNRAFSSLIEFGVMSPILNALNRSIGLSDMSVEFNSNGYMVLRFARSLDKAERIFLTYEYSPDTNGVYRNLIGMEYRYKHGIRVRVSQDVKGSTYLWIQGNRKF